MKSKLYTRLYLGLSAITLALSAPSAYSDTVTFNTAGTTSWLCPPGVTTIEVECWGGGGAGGSGRKDTTAGTNTSQNGGGGGGGAYARKTSVPVTPGLSYTITIPAAAVSGSAGTTTNGAGRVNGGTVTFVGDTSVTTTAAGGQGGANAYTTVNGTTAAALGVGGTTASSIGDFTFAGGTGSAGNTGATNVSGSGGGGAGNANPGGGAVTTASTTVAGAGGAVGGGAGGAGRSGGNTNAGVGAPGQTPGGGGGGGHNQGISTRLGGTGGLGQITITFTPVYTPIVKENNTDDLNLTTSWVGGVVPSAANLAVWDDTVTSANTTNLAADTTWAGIQVADPAGAVTINGGNTLTLGAAPIDIDLSAATQDLTLNCALALGAANTWDVASGKTVTLGGVVSGSAAVTKQGSGTAILAGANTYTGNTIVNDGNLNITGTLTGNPASSSLLYGGSAATTVVNVSNDMTLFTIGGANHVGSAAVYNQTAGTVNVSPTSTTNNYVATLGYGYFNLTGGTYKQNTNRFSLTNIGGTPALGVAYIGGTGILDLTTSTSMIIGYTGTGSLTVGPGGSVLRNGGANQLWLTTNPNSNGTINLAGGEFNTGTVAAAALRVGNNTAGPQTGVVNLAKGTLTMGQNVVSQVTGTGTNLYANYAGGTLKAAATLSNVMPNASTAFTVTSTIFGPIDNSAAVGDASQNFAGGMIVDTNTFNMTYSSALLGASGNGVKQANISLTGGSGYVGAPVVQFTGGTLVPGGSPAAGYAVISGGAVTGIVITAPGTYSVDPSVTLTGGGGTGASVSLSALTANPTGAGLTKLSDGILTLSGANTYTGPTQVSGGTLQLNSLSATVPTTSGITIEAAATLGFTTGTASTLDLTGKTLTLNGGTLAFDLAGSGSNDMITVNDFTLTANGALAITPVGAIVSGASYTLLTSTNAISNSGPFTLTPQPLGRLTFASNIGANTISITPTLDEGAWNLVGGGDWSVGNPAPNWSNYKPTVAGDAALFGSAIGAPSTINVDSPQSIGYLRFNNTNAYTIGNGASSNLTLDNGTVPAVIAVNSGAHTIAENVTLLSNLLISPATSTSLEISGIISGTNALTHSGLGTTTLSGANTVSGAINVTSGQLNISNWSSSTLGVVTVATGGILELSGSATYNIATQMVVGASSATTGTVNQTGGTVSFTASNALLLGTGIGIGSTGIYNLSGGTLTSYSSGTRGVMLGTNDGNTATFNLSGTGNLNLPASILMIGRSDTAVAGCTANFNQTSATSTALVNVLTLGGTGAGTATATMTLSAGTFVANTFTKLGIATNDIVVMNIGGTADVTLPAFPTVRGTDATVTINFDGGILRPTAASATYMGGLTNAFIKAGGVTFNTGFDITVTQDLLTDLVSTGGGLTKAGANTLSLGGTNTYTGDTLISGGILGVTNPSAMGTGDVSINGGTRLVVATGIDLPNDITISTNVGASGRGLIEASATAGTAVVSGDITINNVASAGGHIAAPTVGTVLHLTGTITSSVDVAQRTGTVMYSGGGTGYTFLGSGGTIRVGANNGIATTAIVSLGNYSTAGILDLNGFNQSLVGISKAGSAATIGNSSESADSILTLTGTSSFAGVIQDVIGSGTMKVNLSVIGGETTLTGANTYTGTTSVTAGTLSLVGGSTASPVTVSAGASLGFTIGSPTTSTSTFNLSAGTIKITGSPTLNSYDLITTSAGITGTPVLDAPIAGYDLKVQGNSLKLVKAGYASWASINAIGSTPDQDKDGDGVNNAIEYVLGGDVNTNDLSKLPQSTIVGTNMVFTFLRDVDTIDGTTIVKIEVGTTLAAWPDVYTVGVNTAGSTAGVVVTEDSSPGFDTITLTVPMGIDVTKFGRLNVVVP